MGKKKESAETKAVNAIANLFGVTESDAAPVAYSNRRVTIDIPCELRLGQAIVNALSHLHKLNPTITEEPSTALYYVSDSQLQEAIDRFHKPYGFGNG